MSATDVISNALLSNIQSTPAMTPTELVKLAQHVGFSLSYSEQRNVELAKKRIQIFAHALLGAANKM